MSVPAALAAALALVLHPHHQHRPHHHPPRVHHVHRHWTVYTYARARVLRHWHSTAQWEAFSQIVSNESGWDPCAYYPGQHDCHYSGSNACGIPQRDRYPQPCAWAGRLWTTRFRQVDWMIRYIDGKWGTPGNALYHETHGSY